MIFVAMKRHSSQCSPPTSEVAASFGEKTEQDVKLERTGDAAFADAGQLDGSVDRTPFWSSFEGIAIAVLLVLAGSCYVVQQLL